MQPPKVLAYLPSFTPVERAHPGAHPWKMSIPLDLGEIWMAKVIRES